MDPASKEILIDEAVAKLSHFAKLYGVRSLFIVGGFCRDKYFNQIEEVNDIDVASAFEDQAMQLGSLFASEVLHRRKSSSPLVLISPVFKVGSAEWNRDWLQKVAEFVKTLGDVRLSLQTQKIIWGSKKGV